MVAGQGVRRGRGDLGRGWRRKGATVRLSGTPTVEEGSPTGGSWICRPKPRVDDVVKRLLSLEMANQKEKLKIKQEQLMKKVVENPEDTRSLEARIVALTIKIRNYEEHMQKHRKDKAHKRYLLMSLDQRKKMLKNLRKTNYDVFEKTCRELGIEYTFPPLYYRTAHRRFVAKRALCLRVFQEAKKLKKQKRILKAKAKAAAAPKQDDQENPESSSKACADVLKENQ
uniref:28S ribosomal protein S15, mitochondrial isoform X2 n=1 Tax=Ictidomys tridecemlineatus TaxID=43179 RepID=UPI001A9DF1B2|nr:28S ribosomal protein S15, mitochondrial isoform X2 [Ictidomys tridecemlineatus]